MSVEAITWALSQRIDHSSAKFVLVVLANCASGDGNLAYPSTMYLAEATGQDRKTVLANLGRLRDMGAIEDSGQRVGATKQVVVYRLNISKFGTVEESLKRNSTENGTVPKTEGNSPVFPVEQSRFSAKQSQKRDTEPSEPKGTVRNQTKRIAFGSAADLPDWLPRESWVDWCNYRRERKKELTTKAVGLSIASLDNLRGQGFDPALVINTAIVNGWQGLYAPTKPTGVPHDTNRSGSPRSAVDRVAYAIASRGRGDDQPDTASIVSVVP